MPTAINSAKRLTKTVIEAAATRPKPYFLADAGNGAVTGFCVRIHPTGRRTFCFRFRPAGRASAVTLVTIGELGPLTVEDARKRAGTLRGDLDHPDPKRNPRTQRQAAKAAKLADHTAVTLGALCDAYLTDANERGVKASTLDLWGYHLGTHVRKLGPTKGSVAESPLRVALGRVRAKDVTRAQLKAFYATHRVTTPTAARRTLKLIGAVYRFGAAEGMVDATCTPTAGITLGKVSAPRRTALASAQYAALGAALTTAVTIGLPPAPSRKGRARGTSKAREAKVGSNPSRKLRGKYKPREADPAQFKAYPVACAALRFLACSGWRKGEVRGLRWDAIDVERCDARLGDTKTGESVRPLGATLLAMIAEERDRQTRDGVPSMYVFSALDTPARPLGDVGPLWANLTHAASLTLTPHGLRHSYITVARELGYGDHVIAALVGHSLGSMTSRYGIAPGDIVREAADKVSATIAARLAAAPSADTTPS